MDNNMEELDGIMTLINEDGEEVEYEFIDSITYENAEYVVLLPVEQEDCEAVILAVESDGDMEIMWRLTTRISSLRSMKFSRSALRISWILRTDFCTQKDLSRMRAAKGLFSFCCRVYGNIPGRCCGVRCPPALC